jgi:cysteine desulfurase
VSSAYLDHAASTSLRPVARAVLEAALDETMGNPSGQHRWARAARRRLDDARDEVAAAVGVAPEEVVFTSGGTEAENLAITGVVRATGAHAACLATDHHAVIDPVRAAGGTVLTVDGRAVVDPERIARQLRAVAERAGTDPGPAVVSFALVNNELGVLQRWAELVEAVRAAWPGVVVHTDAVAAASWLDLRPVAEAVDLLTLSGHKLGGPQGVGALVVRRGTPLAPVSLGGSQERARRAGTPGVAAAASMAAALSEAVAERPATVARVTRLRDRLRRAMVDACSEQVVDTVGWSGTDAERVANVVHLCARDVHREALLVRLDLDGVAASAGSSCASGAPERSHVISALGVPEDLADGALRLSLGWSTTEDEVDHAIAVIPGAVAALVGTAGAGAASSGAAW